MMLAMMRSQESTLGKLKWLADEFVENTAASIDFHLVQGSCSIVGEWMKLTCEAHALPIINSYGSGEHLGLTNPRATATQWLAAVSAHLMPQLNVAQLTSPERVTLFGHIVKNCSRNPCANSDAFMHELIQTVLGDEIASMDVTRETIEWAMRGRMDIACHILRRASSFSKYNFVVNPFLPNANGHTLDAVADQVNQPQASVYLQVVNMMKVTIRKQHVPLLQSILPLHGVTMDSALSPDELDKWSLQFIDCFGRPTATLKRLLDQPPQAAQSDQA